MIVGWFVGKFCQWTASIASSPAEKGKLLQKKSVVGNDLNWQIKELVKARITKNPEIFRDPMLQESVSRYPNIFFSALNLDGIHKISRGDVSIEGKEFIYPFSVLEQQFKKACDWIPSQGPQTKSGPLRYSVSVCLDVENTKNQGTPTFTVSENFNL